MYKLSVPIMSATVTEKNRDAYVKLCREAGASRVFLCTGSPMEPIPAHLGANVAFFKSEGFEVGVWTDTLGHGVVLLHVENGGVGSRFQQMVNVDGEERLHANCPLDPAFRLHIADYIASLAELGPDIVMLDDDFRMSQHGIALTCVCPAHLSRIGEILGEEVTLEALRPHILSGKANRYRSAWIRSQREGLEEMATDIRAEVDRRAPDVTVTLCTAYAPWNVDGVDPVKLSRILAGKHPPILRLTGAPYWATKSPRRYSLISIFEIARMLASFVAGEGLDLMSEGDVYPRPRYTCPASFLELYDMATRIDGGYNGILKYMFDYVAGPEMETGYLAMHGEDRTLLDETLPRLFPNGANEGVRIVAHPHTMEDADLDLSTLSPLSPLPQDAVMLGHCGIPTVYRGEGVCLSVFGESARRCDLAELKHGAVLDAVSAVILTERGVDVGLSSYGMLTKERISFLTTEDPEYKSFITGGGVRMLPAELKEGAHACLFSSTPTGRYPVAYSYENKAGERFLVFLFEGDSLQATDWVAGSGLLRNCVIQRVLAETLPWLAQKPLPAYCVGNPDLYLMCGRDGDALSVALLNTFSDPVLQPTVVLDGEYEALECYGCTAELRGNTVTLTSRLYGHSAAFLRVHGKRR